MNLWEGIEPGTRRRTLAVKKHDVFYFRQTGGEIGMFMEVSLEKRNSLDSRLKFRSFYFLLKDTKLYIVLKEDKYADIFGYICQDILADIENREKADIIGAAESRLYRWQKMLEELKGNAISSEIQRGLFTELHFLDDVLDMAESRKMVIEGWTGPEKDKQDFIFSDCAVEVKSYSSSRGREITVSSAGQLDPVKETLYLAAYGISLCENGSSIKDLYKKITDKLKEEQISVKALFNEKVMKYGYNFWNEHQELEVYRVDEILCFEVRDDFPRLVPSMIPEGVIGVRYKIDLSGCSKYVTETEKIKRRII